MTNIPFIIRAESLLIKTTNPNNRDLLFLFSLINHSGGDDASRDGGHRRDRYSLKDS